MRVAALLLLGSLSSCSKEKDYEPPPSPPEKTEAKDLAAETVARLRAADAKRTRALVDALATLGPRKDLGPCPIAAMPPNSQQAAPGDDIMRGPIPFKLERMTLVTAAELPASIGARLRSAQPRIQEALAKTSARPGLLVVDPRDAIRSAGDPASFPWELVVVVDARKDPRVIDAGLFAGGYIVGRAFLYDSQAEAVVCAAAVLAESSTRLVNRGGDQDLDGGHTTLSFDLENEAFRSAALGLVRAGPSVKDGGAR